MCSIMRMILYSCVYFFFGRLIHEPVLFLRQMDERSLRSRGATMIDAVPIVGGVGFPQSGTAYLLDPKKQKKK